ncbi:uncharacterized protein LOC125027805 [Penaeus chinensis]|uniref:uncharacterized protein LOC125027805 n=1 Tax=Penaeus chinensis TaxID=139456 RepID=UPI001FB5BBB9|nr:uncharacterized protein LOC125027805 [Penaeus chinensis]
MAFTFHDYCDSTAAPSYGDNSTLSYCLEDTEYEIKAPTTADHLFAKKYADVADQSADDLVDMLTRDQKEALDYSYYTGASTCAQNVDGKWRVIVNDVHYYSQTARLQTCLFPEAACRALAPCCQSHCT